MSAETPIPAVAEPPLAAAIRDRAEDWAENALNPGACADAVVAVLALHQPSRRLAWPLPEKFGEGCCAYCSRYTLVEEFRDERGYVQHDHGVDVDIAWCGWCSDEDGGGRWPCPTVRAIADALGLDHS